MKYLINGLDPTAIAFAIRKINETAEMKGRIDRILRKVAEEAVKVAYQTYKGSVQVEAVKQGDGYSIIASGERVCFIEFGAGIYAQAHMNALADPAKLGFVVEPGSWSMTEGQRTWADWEDKPNQYPYNQPARPGMYEAYKAIKRNAEQWAKEALKNDRY